MRLPDPIGIKHKILSTSIISATIQLQGKRYRQEDFFAADNNDTFVIADGMGGLPHGETAGKLAVESAIWSVNLSKKRLAYWKDKKLLGGRIIRSVNWTLYNKRRDVGFEDGMGSTLLVLLFGEKQFYVYSVGDTRGYLFRNNTLSLLTPLDRDGRGFLTKALGIYKNAPEEFFYRDMLLPNDLFLLATDGVADYIREEKISEIIRSSDTDEHLTSVANQLISEAKKSGSTDNMTVSIIKNLMTGSV